MRISPLLVLKTEAHVMIRFHSSTAVICSSASLRTIGGLALDAISRDHKCVDCDSRACEYKLVQAGT